MLREVPEIVPRVAIRSSSIILRVMEGKRQIEY
jgi:hypothetical protein